MKAVVVGPGRQVVQKEVDPPEPRGGEAAAQVLYAGICRTDRQLFLEAAVQRPVVPGHEVVCRLHDGDATYALNNEIFCGDCDCCREGKTSHCVNLRELGINCDGGYAEQIAAPLSNLFRFEFDKPALGVLIEPLSCALHGFDRIRRSLELTGAARPDAIVVGGGVSGALLSFLLTQEGQLNSLRVHDIAPDPLPWAEALQVDRLARLKPDSAHLALECSGSPQGLAGALTAARKGGVVCVYGVPSQAAGFPISPKELFARELTLLTSFAGCDEPTFVRAVELIEANQSFFETLLGRFVPLERVAAELIDWRPLPGTRTVIDLT